MSRIWRKLAAFWAGAALVGLLLIWLGREFGWASPHTMPLYAALVIAIAVGIVMFAQNKLGTKRIK